MFNSLLILHIIVEPKLYTNGFWMVLTNFLSVDLKCKMAAIV
jgi:hypothetical protein